MELSGGSIRGEVVFNTKQFVSSVFADDPSFNISEDGNIQTYRWELGKRKKDEMESIPLRMYKEEYSSANGDRIKFQSLFENPIIVGDIIYDGKRDCYWICTESFNRGDMQYEGKFTLCNWTLKWQNHNGDILEYPCYDTNTTQYNSGEQSNRQFVIGSSQHMITLPYDENTVVLNTPRRFYLDYNSENPTVFEITQNDTTSRHVGKKGLVRITLMECPKNKNTDRSDLGICDYFDPEKRDENETVVGEASPNIKYSRNTIISGGSKRKFEAEFYDYQGKPVDFDDYAWDIICDFKDSLDVSTDKNVILIGIHNDDLIDESFKLVLTNNETGKTDELTIKVESVL